MEVKGQFPTSDVELEPQLETKLEKPVRVKITLVVTFDAESLDDITEIKEVMDEAVDTMCQLGEMEEEECKEEILPAL